MHSLVVYILPYSNFLYKICRVLLMYHFIILVKVCAVTYFVHTFYNYRIQTAKVHHSSCEPLQHSFCNLWLVLPLHIATIGVSIK